MRWPRSKRVRFHQRHWSGCRRCASRSPARRADRRLACRELGFTHRAQRFRAVAAVHGVAFDEDGVGHILPARLDHVGHFLHQEAVGRAHAHGVGADLPEVQVGIDDRQLRFERRLNPQFCPGSEFGELPFPHGFGGADDFISMPLQCSAKMMGMPGCMLWMSFTDFRILDSTSSAEAAFLSDRLGMQSRIKREASSSLTRSITGCSSCPFPENPRLMIRLFSFLPRMFVQARPGLLAHPPCRMDVP